MITRENYEEYMLLLADGELSPSETEELKAFVKGNTEMEQEMAYYMSARMVPDANDIYIGKEELLKKAYGARIIGLQRNWAYGIAAGILLLIFFGIFKQQGGNSKSEIVKKDVPQTNSKFQIPNSSMQAPVAKQEDQPSTIPASKHSITKIKKTITSPVNNSFNEETNNIARAEAPKQDSIEKYIARADISANKDSQPKRFGWRVDKVKKDSISHIARVKSPHDNRGWRKEPILFGQGTRNVDKQNNDTSTIVKAAKPDENKQPFAERTMGERDHRRELPEHMFDTAALIAKVPVDNTGAEPKQKRSFFAHLPIVGRKNIGINLVTDAVENNVSKVKQIKENLKNTDVVIKLGKKEILAFNL